MADEITDSTPHVDETEHGFYVKRGDAYEWVWKEGHAPGAAEAAEHEKATKKKKAEAE